VGAHFLQAPAASRLMLESERRTRKHLLHALDDRFRCNREDHAAFNQATRSSGLMHCLSEFSSIQCAGTPLLLRLTVAMKVIMPPGHPTASLDSFFAVLVRCDAGPHGDAWDIHRSWQGDTVLRVPRPGVTLV
jgi:hypothetical protein